MLSDSWTVEHKQNKSHLTITNYKKNHTTHTSGRLYPKEVRDRKDESVLWKGARARQLNTKYRVSVGSMRARRASSAAAGTDWGGARRPPDHPPLPLQPPTSPPADVTRNPRKIKANMQINDNVFFNLKIIRFFWRSVLRFALSPKTT